MHVCMCVFLESVSRYLRMDHHQSRTLPGLVTVPKPTKTTRVFTVDEAPQDCELAFDGRAGKMSSPPD